jgi:DHA1 family bicyclomycin/chloramphenicol resistance-like MFS transporter
MRRISHVAMILFTIISAIGYAKALGGKPDFAFAYALFSVLLMMFAVIATNFTAISLEPMGNLAGTATSITGFVSTTFGAILGGSIGQLFNGTVQPLFGGFAVFGAITIVATLWAEGGKLFNNPGDSPQIDPGAAHF